MILNSEGYEAASAHELLEETARGYVPLDQRLVRTLLGRGDAVFADILRFLKEPREDDRVGLDELVVDIARQARTPAALAFLAECARSNGFDFPDELTEAFVEQGAEAVETLLALYQESGGASDVRFAMSGLGVRDPRVLDALLDLLQKDPAEGSIALGLYGDPAAKPALERALAAAGEDEKLRQDLESGLWEIDHAETAHTEPFDIWGFYPEEDTPYFAAFENRELLAFLASPVPEYRLRAVKMLMFEEPPAEIAQRIFDVARSDADVRVRAVAWENLEAVAEPKEILGALRAKLEDETAPMEERAGALAGLAPEIRDDEALVRFVLEFYGRPETREQAVKAMWRSGDRRFELRIPEALDDPDLGVRRQAVTAAGMFGMVALAGRIERCFEDDNLRDAALYAYAHVAPVEVTPARMRKLFARIELLAGGLDEEEGIIVGKALDDRLEAHGQDTVFHREETWEAGDEEEGPAETAPAQAATPAKVGRNDPCPCGSGKKYKKCCGQ